MLQYEDIRLSIVRGLEANTGHLVIDQSGGGDVPRGDFMTYHFTDGFGSPKGQPVITQQGDKQIRRETVTFTVSFMCYADDKDQALVNALKARDWFKGSGHELLKNTLDVIVIDIGDVQNRDLNLGEEWERRQGFDVEFRALDVVETTLNWIHEPNIQRSDTI